MFSVPTKRIFNPELSRVHKKTSMRQQAQTHVLKFFTENNIQKRQSWKHHKYIESINRSPED